MNKTYNFLFLAILCSYTYLFGLDSNDTKNIQDIVGHFTNAWNFYEGHGSADYYEQNADFVNIFGMAFSGKQEIEARHVQIHESFLKGTTFEVTDLRLREAKPGVVIAHVFWEVSKPENETMKGIFTHVILKNQENWQITATQNTLISK